MASHMIKALPAACNSLYPRTVNAVKGIGSPMNLMIATMYNAYHDKSGIKPPALETSLCKLN